MLLRIVAITLSAVAASCGDIDFPTRPSREIPGFYFQQDPPIAVDLSNQPCRPRFGHQIVVICPLAELKAP